MGNGASRTTILLSTATVAAAILRWLTLRSRRKQLQSGQRGMLPTPSSAGIPPRPSRLPPTAAAARPTAGTGAIPPRPSRQPPPASTSAATAGIPPRPSRPPPALVAAKDSGRPPVDAELWICVDFEWTCDEGENRKFHPDAGEIIEFSYVIYDAKAGAMTCEGQHYCKNVRTPITDFCTELTQITDEKLASAGSLKDAISGLESALAKEGLAGRTCCAVAHGSADLELMLPRNCKTLGIEVPSFLRKYVDLREAAQRYVAARGLRGRASTLRQICDVMRVQMLGDEHCGLDDSWMVLLATQQLLKEGADMESVDLDAERKAFSQADNTDTSLCLDGLPYYAVAAEVLTWLGRHTGRVPRDDALWVVLGTDGRPSGRAVVDFDSHQEAVAALEACDLGRCIVCHGLPDDPPRERLVLIRPLRTQERVLQRRNAGFAAIAPALARFPGDTQEITEMRVVGKGNGKGSSRSKVDASQGCEGHVKMWNSEKHFGFITYSEGDVFVHKNDCVTSDPFKQLNDPLKQGDLVSFDIAEDERNGKMKAVNVRRQDDQ